MEPKPWPYTQELVLSFWPCSNWEQSTYTIHRNSTRLNYTSGQEALIWPKIKNSFVVVSKEELGGTANCRYTIISRNREVVLCSTGVLRNSLIIWSCLLFLKKIASQTIFSNEHLFYTDSWDTGGINLRGQWVWGFCVGGAVAGPEACCSPFSFQLSTQAAACAHSHSIKLSNGSGVKWQMSIGFEAVRETSQVDLWISTASK